MHDKVENKNCGEKASKPTRFSNIVTVPDA
jgi:hypothetical protein